MNKVFKAVSYPVLGVATIFLSACGGKSSSVSDSNHPTFSWKKVEASSVYKPSGDIDDATPTFEWKAKKGAISYQFGHENTRDNSDWLEYNVTADEAGCTTSPICTYTPNDVQLSAGIQRAWWVRGKTTTAWQAWSSAHVFKIVSDTTTPTTGSLPVSPSGIVKTGTPTFKWTQNTGATKYQIGYESTDGSGWHRISVSASACDNGYCEYTIANSLQSDVGMEWWVRSKINGSYGNFGKGLTFSVEKGSSSFRDLIPEDSNTALGGETDIVYIADIRTEDGGKNRAIRIDAKNMEVETFDIKKGSNPHSIDRAGDSNKFYIRTQSSTSISVINFETGTEKTVDLGDLFPRTTGATNLKYGIQLIAAHNKPVIAIIDINTDEIIGRVGDETATAPNMANGHPVWLDNDHFALIDRVNNTIRVYKVEKDTGHLSFKRTDTIYFNSASHISHTMVKVSTSKFVVMGEGNVEKGLLPFVAKMVFNSNEGFIEIIQTTPLTQSNKIVKGVNPALHHGGISPDGKHFYATNLDGKTYILNRESMDIIKVIETGLGSGHVTFSVEENVAVITNHFATHVTIIDLDSLEIKAEIEISNTEFDEDDRHLLQLHNPLISSDGRYFYTAASHDGDFVKIDLRTLKVDSKLHVGGILDQTSS